VTSPDVLDAKNLEREIRRRVPVVPDQRHHRDDEWEREKDDRKRKGGSEDPPVATPASPRPNRGCSVDAGCRHAGPYTPLAEEVAAAAITPPESGHDPVTSERRRRLE
jgi:hypothetical protein